MASEGVHCIADDRGNRQPITARVMRERAEAHVARRGISIDVSDVDRCASAGDRVYAVGFRGLDPCPGSRRSSSVSRSPPQRSLRAP